MYIYISIYYINISLYYYITFLAFYINIYTKLIFILWWYTNKLSFLCATFVFHCEFCSHFSVLICKTTTLVSQIPTQTTAGILLVFIKFLYIKKVHYSLLISQYVSDLLFSLFLFFYSCISLLSSHNYTLRVLRLFVCLFVFAIFIPGCNYLFSSVNFSSSRCVRTFKRTEKISKQIWP